MTIMAKIYYLPKDNIPNFFYRYRGKAEMKLPPEQAPGYQTQLGINRLRQEVESILREIKLKLSQMNPTGIMFTGEER